MNVQLTTLTPVHIGSGEVLHGQHDHLYFDKERVIAILDHQKVQRLLPAGEEQIQQWVNLIDQDGDLLAWLRKWKPDLKPHDVAKPGQIIEIEDGTPGSGHDLRTMIRTGTGETMIPGSSLKGAIKTVLWRHLLPRKYPYGLQWDDFARQRKKKEWERKKDSHNRWNFSDKTPASKVFGSSPNVDLGRAIRPADIHFSKTRLYKVQSINRFYNKWDWKHDSIRLMESIPPYQVSNSRLHLKRIPAVNNADLPKDVFELFLLASKHTQTLLEREIDFWRADKLVCPSAEYEEKILELLKKVKGLGKDACILRLGQGIGFTSMTGGWADDHLNGDDLEDFGFHMRDCKFSEDPPFPKSRALTRSGLPLGFVRLQII